MLAHTIFSNYRESEKTKTSFHGLCPTNTSSCYLSKEYWRTTGIEFVKMYMDETDWILAGSLDDTQEIFTTNFGGAVLETRIITKRPTQITKRIQSPAKTSQKITFKKKFMYFSI